MIKVASSLVETKSLVARDHLWGALKGLFFVTPNHSLGTNTDTRSYNYPSRGGWRITGSLFQCQPKYHFQTHPNEAKKQFAMTKRDATFLSSCCAAI